MTNLCFQIKQCSITKCHGLPSTNQTFPVSSLASAETDYVYLTAKAPLRPEEPKTEGSKGFHALIHLLNKFLISVLYPRHMNVQALALALQLNRFEEL